MRQFFANLIVFFRTIWFALTGAQTMTIAQPAANPRRARKLGARATLRLLVSERSGIRRSELFEQAAGLQRQTFTPPRSRRHMKLLLQTDRTMRCLQGGLVIAA